MIRRLWTFVLVAVLASIGVVSVATPEAIAATGSDFDPGYIVSDAEFYNYNAMTAGQIQSFLEQRVPVCHPERSSGPDDPIVCMKDYRITTSTLAADAYCPGTYQGASNELASTIIYKVAQACRVSPKALLVTLEKENSLVSHTWPSNWRYLRAMGFACPDTAPCDTQYYGFQNQVWRAARQFQRYKALPSNYNYRAGVPNLIQYNPNASCGRDTVVIQNQATAGLYNYTPYQPNQAALDNLYGTGDSCSSYGNRNFWRMWTDWFGSPTQPLCSVNPAADIGAYWQDKGGASSALGASVPPGVIAGPGGVWVGYYANGDLYCRLRTGPIPVMGLIRTAFGAAGGGTGPLGFPTADQVPHTANGITGAYQTFDRGLVVSSSTTGSFAVLDGAIREAWGGLGGSGGVLGWPVANQESVAAGLRQRFQNGVVVVPAGKAAVVVLGAIGTYWSTGANPTTLGEPTGAQVAWSAGGVSGAYQNFAKGMVLSSATTGTFAVLDGPVRSKWGALGGSGGSLGWPIGDQQALTGGGYKQQFQGGTIFVSTSGVGSTLSGAILSYWQAGSHAASLGFPTSSPVAWTAGGVTGTYQNFELGMVLSSTTTGTFAVLNGPIRDKWGNAGGSGGTYGWPTGDQTVVSGVAQQQFQGGTLNAGSGGGGGSGAGTAAAITTYWSTGSNSSRLGQASGGAVSWSAGGVSGAYQNFAKGMVLSSATTGTFAVLDGPVRNRWGALGGSGGSLGWPTGDQQALTGGGYKQSFQGGTIFVSSSGVGSTLTGAILAYWESGSHAATLGFPIESPVAWTAGGVSGTYQNFEKGMVLSSSPTGTFAVLHGAIRNKWGALGGSGGSVGWPIADQENISGGVQQRFQRGTIVAPTGGTAYVATS